MLIKKDYRKISMEKREKIHSSYSDNININMKNELDEDLDALKKDNIILDDSIKNIDNLKGNSEEFDKKDNKLNKNNKK